MAQTLLPDFFRASDAASRVTFRPENMARDPAPVFTAETLRQAVETLRRNNVPAFDDGRYRFIRTPVEIDILRQMADDAEEWRPEAAAEIAARQRAAWERRICTGIDAARRATPVTAAEIRERNGWRVSWRVVPR